MAVSPRFESLPSEIRNMIYSYLLPPAHLKKKYKKRSLSACWKLHYLACVLPKGNTAILRTNRNINREALAVLYSDVLLVSIDWNINDCAYVEFVKLPHHVTFTFVLPGAPLPPCVVHIQHNYHNENSTAARSSTIVAATDFPAICRLLFEPCLNYMDEARTSYSVLSLPKMGYNVDKLRELIWSPLLVLRKCRLANLGEETHCNLRLIDCTGVFEQTTAELDWDPNLDDGDDTDQEGESDDNDSDDDGSTTELNGEEDDDEQEIDREDKNMEENDEEDHDEINSDHAKSNECSDDDGSINEEKGTTDDEEHANAEATINDHQSSYPEGKMSNSPSPTSDHDGDVNAHILLGADRVAGGQPNDEFDHKVLDDIGANVHVDGIADKKDAEEH